MWRVRTEVILLGVALQVLACEAWESVPTWGPSITWDSILPEVRVSGGGPGVELEVRPEIHLAFSQPLAESSIAANGVVLVAWLDGDVCEWPSDLCTKGTCVMGRCQIDPLSRSRFLPANVMAVALDHELTRDALGLRLRPHRALAPHRLHSLVVGPDLRGRDGASFVGDMRHHSLWRRDFRTADRGSSGPEVDLIVPFPGSDRIPTGLRRVRVSSTHPVDLTRVYDAILALRAHDDAGTWVPLVDPSPCRDRPDGRCLEWRVAGSLHAATRYSLEAQALWDLRGRNVQPSSRVDAEIGFVSASDITIGPPPRLEDLAVWHMAGCVFAEVLAQEGPWVLELEAQGRVAFVHGTGWISVGLRIHEPVLAGAGIAVDVRVDDLAGRAVSRTELVDIGTGRDSASLVITEVLSHAALPPAPGEFVEIQRLDFGLPKHEDAAATLEGLWLADRPWAEVLAALRSGANTMGKRLPPFRLRPGQLGLIVGEEFDGHDLGLDGAAGERAENTDEVGLIRMPGALGNRGLANAGEAISLYVDDPPRLVASYGGFVSTGAAAHRGRSVQIDDPWNCDLPAHWRLSPALATPGRLP